jgi:hypothetical protein
LSAALQVLLDGQADVCAKLFVELLSVKESRTRLTRMRLPSICGSYSVLNATPAAQRPCGFFHSTATVGGNDSMRLRNRETFHKSSSVAKLPQAPIPVWRMPFLTIQISASLAAWVDRLRIAEPEDKTPWFPRDSAFRIHHGTLNNRLGKTSSLPSDFHLLPAKDSKVVELGEPRLCQVRGASAAPQACQALR